MRRLRAHAEFAQVAQRGGLFSSATWQLKVEKFFFEDQQRLGAVHFSRSSEPYGAVRRLQLFRWDMPRPLCRVLSVCGAVSPCVCVV